VAVGVLRDNGPSDADRSPGRPKEPSMTRPLPRLVGYATVGAGLAAAGYVGLVTGACPVDLGVGRRVRPLGPQLVDMAAPREVVFDVVAEPYLGRAPRALADKLRVLERGSDLVLAAHFTPLGGRLGLVAQTVETVRFTRPERVDFRLVRGPVPHVVETFTLTELAAGAGTRLTYDGELGADLWRVGQWWGELVARQWERTVAASLAGVKAEAERRASSSAGRRRARSDEPPSTTGR
jgi:Polyketide cyclase / dehydrase and lipid transport